MPLTFYESNNNRQERAARALAKGRTQAVRNALEWVRRANLVASDTTSQANYWHILDAAHSELAPYGIELNAVL